MKFAVAMTLTIVGSVLGDFFMKQAATRRPANRSISLGRARLIRKAWFGGGLVMLTIHFIAFLVALKIAPVSIVIPLMSCTYVGTTILAMTILKERVPPLRWVGIGVIMMGVVLLFRSS